MAKRGRLARRYTLLARIGPPGPRREELLDTLIDGAPPGRTRPTLRETINLIGYGLRARLGRPASTAVVVLACLVALASGLLGAAGAARAGWAFVPALTTDQALAATVFPGQRVWGGGDAELFVETADGEGLEFGFADYWVEHTPETRDLEAYATAAAQRLTAAGWEVRGDVAFVRDVESVTPSSEVRFWAVRDGQVLSYLGVHWSDRAYYDSDGAASFTLSRSAPGWLGLVALGGGLAGALAGWLLTGWASRRTEERPAVAAPVAVLAWTAVMLTLFTGLIGGLWSWSPDRPGDEAVWLALLALTSRPGWFALGLGLLGLTAALLPAVRPRVRLGLLGAVLLVVVGAGVVAARPPTALASCAPVGPPDELPAARVAHSRVARVFVTQDSTPDQRNLAEAAIFRVWGTRSLSFHHDPTAREYREAYCGGGRLEGDSGMRVPYFFDVGLSSPGAFPALEAEVAHLPGVVAVRHAPGD